MSIFPILLSGVLALNANPVRTADPSTVGQQSPSALRVHESGAFDGYTLISPLNSTTVFLLDMQGAIKHRWETDCATTGAVYLLENGNLLRCGQQADVPRFQGGGLGGRLQEIDWNGQLVWQHILADERRAHHHDIEPLSNGNLLAIAWEHHDRKEALARGRDPRQIDEQGLWPDVVVELRPIRPRGAEVVWEWNAWDHLVQDFDPALVGFGSVPDLPGRIDINADHRGRPPRTVEENRRLEDMERDMRALGYTSGGTEDAPPRAMRAPDWLHTNSVDYLEQQQLILLSVSHLNELWVIDHSTTTKEAKGSKGGRRGHGGELLWRWGNPRNYGAGTDHARKLFYQHSASWIAGEQPGELRVLYFNNGGERPTGPHSSVEEIVLPFDRALGFTREKEKPFGPDELAWSYENPPWFFSGFISSAQRLDNGNTLVCEGATGRIFELTPDLRVVWEFLNPFGGATEAGDFKGDAPAKALFQATRIRKDHPGLRGRSL